MSEEIEVWEFLSEEQVNQATDREKREIDVAYDAEGYRIRGTYERLVSYPRDRRDFPHYIS